MDQMISNRYFQGLSDAELLAWRPSSYHDSTNGNVSKANREYRRRAKRAGFPDVYAWMKAAK